MGRHLRSYPPARRRLYLVYSIYRPPRQNPLPHREPHPHPLTPPAAALPSPSMQHFPHSPVISPIPFPCSATTSKPPSAASAQAKPTVSSTFSASPSA